MLFNLSKAYVMSSGVFYSLSSIQVDASAMQELSPRHQSRKPNCAIQYGIIRSSDQTRTKMQSDPVYLRAPGFHLVLAE